MKDYLFTKAGILGNLVASNDTIFYKLISYNVLRDIIPANVEFSNE